MEFKKYLPLEICNWLKNTDGITDITMISGKNLFITKKGKTVESSIFISDETVKEIVNKICKGSIYANQNTLKEGFVTLEDGSRIGVTGTIGKDEKGNTVCLKNITAINIRLAREIYGAADEIIKHIVTENRIYNTLIIAPPSCGKTTILRDAARQLGNMYRVGIIDERSEIARKRQVGKYTFVVEGTGKYDGIMMLLRSMAPQIIITDELGNKEDDIAVKTLINAGVKIICSVHGYDEKDVLKRTIFKNMIRNNFFEKIIVLSDRLGAGTIEKIIDAQEVCCV